MNREINWILIKAKNSWKAKIGPIILIFLRLTFTRSNRRPERKMLEVRSTLIDAAEVFFCPTFGQDDHSF